MFFGFEVAGMPGFGVAVVSLILIADAVAMGLLALLDIKLQRRELQATSSRARVAHGARI